MVRDSKSTEYSEVELNGHRIRLGNNKRLGIDNFHLNYKYCYTYRHGMYNAWPYRVVDNFAIEYIKVVDGSIKFRLTGLHQIEITGIVHDGVLFGDEDGNCNCFIIFSDVQYRRFNKLPIGVRNAITMINEF